MGAVLHEAMCSLQRHHDVLRVGQPEQLAQREPPVMQYDSAACAREQPVLQAIAVESK